MTNNNNNGNIVDMVLACVDKLGRENTAWLAEWYPELFETPIEEWKVIEFFHLFENETDAANYFGYNDIEEMSEDLFVISDDGLNGVIVIE